MVKRLYTELVLSNEGERIRRARLQPENPEFAPIFVDDPDEFR